MTDFESTLDAIETATKIGGEFILFPKEPPRLYDVVTAGVGGRLFWKAIATAADLAASPPGPFISVRSYRSEYHYPSAMITSTAAAPPWTLFAASTLGGPGDRRL